MFSFIGTIINTKVRLSYLGVRWNNLSFDKREDIVVISVVSTLFGIYGLLYLIGR